MKIICESQPQKYLRKIPESARDKLLSAINGIPEKKGDICKLSGKTNAYRLKIHHYRVLFSYGKDGQIIIVDTINTRTNIKY